MSAPGSEENAFFEKPEYSLNKMFLSSIGTWPYQKSPNLIRAFFFVMIGTALAPQLIYAGMVWHENIGKALEAIASSLAAIVSIIKLINAILQKDKLMMIFARIKSDYEILMTMPEWPIMADYAMQGRKITTFFSTFVLTLTVSYGLMPLAPIFLDYVLPLNHTRKRKLLFDVEYMIDQEKYHFPILIHEYVGAYMVIYVVVALDVFFMVCVQHACGLFAVVGARIKDLHISESMYKDKNEVLEYNYTQMERAEAFRKLREGIMMHKTTIEYCKLLESYLTVTAAIVIILNILCLSIVGMQLVLNIKNLDDETRHVAFMFGILNDLFLICLPGQRLMDYSEKVYEDACAADWYSFPKNLQPLFHLILVRSMKPLKLTSGKMATLSMELFLAIVQTAMSYFTVLSSVR